MRRAKVDAPSAEAAETNPYSRLMALNTLGVVKNYERVREFSVAIVGIGGVGVSVCEMLTRCGVGKIILYDFDTIELANMNKMFYRPEQAGWNKTMACRHYCSELNPDTVFEVHNMDITAKENRAKFKARRRANRCHVCPRRPPLGARHKGEAGRLRSLHPCARRACALRCICTASAPRRAELGGDGLA